MMLNCGVLFQWRPCSQMQSMCLASTSATADQLRQQLSNLHKEAESTRVKAKSSRLRLMRLCEAVDRLRRQAAINVQSGKENDAREILFQKKKVMQAIEKLKTRIELFDELSAKLNEAISMKESVLIGNMALDLDVAKEKPVVLSELYGGQNVDLNDPEYLKDQNKEGHAETRVNIGEEIELNNHDESSSENVLYAANSVDIPKQITKYEDFLQHLDLQLNEIEQELEAFLRFSNFLLDSRETPLNLKVQHAAEVLEDIRRARNRIAGGTLLSSKQD
ncbi:uncharacterized protein LOC127266175 [Andrographis paniculata]|uniref:uncharacterized protein LOC127266175 n=1 Tax=Andrographis paniculata TaxID=175694 RepID=UPI0021E78223|nr:uncharacterized protein LOC127266175 [Andrographis paniculata]